MRAVSHCAEGVDVGLGEVDAHGEAVFEFWGHGVRNGGCEGRVEAGIGGSDGDFGGFEGC